MCKPCDTKIHNKGKRLIHVRQLFTYKQLFVIFQEEMIEYFEHIYPLLQKKLAENQFVKNLIIYGSNKWNLLGNYMLINKIKN